jgi:uncharacterized protein YbbC (DUF1343 family)
MLNSERGFGADLTVIACENWTRDTWFEQTGLPWVNPSPSMRSPREAGLYAGTCLVEATSLSVGRGTLRPFEQVGAPYIDGEKRRGNWPASACPACGSRRWSSPRCPRFIPVRPPRSN